MNPSNRHVEILQHSIGLDHRGRGREYRNHFVAGGDDERLCRELVSMGLMVEGQRSDMTGGDPVFFVTEAGKVVARQRHRSP